MPHRVGELLKPRLHLQYRPKRVFRLLVDRPAVLDHLFLAQISEANASRVTHPPAVRLHLAGEDSEEGGLSAAVAPYQPHLLAPAEAKPDAVEDGVPAEGLLYFIDNQDTHGGAESIKNATRVPSQRAMGQGYFLTRGEGPLL